MHLKEKVSILSLKYAINWTISIEVGDSFLGGVCLRPTNPLDPLEVVLRGHLLKNFPRGGVSPNFKSQGGGVRPPRPPLRTSMSENDKILRFCIEN